MPLTIFRLLAAFALLGLLLAPLAGPVTADTGKPDVAAHEMAGMAGDDAAAMPDGMPCCPDETPMPDCSKHCLMAVCAASVALSLPAPGWTFVPSSASDRLSLHQESAPSGVPIVPPPKPPRA